MSLTINPELQAVINPLTAEEYAQLRENIRRDGCLEPITIWSGRSGTIIDGHNRYKICEELGIGFRTKKLVRELNAASKWEVAPYPKRKNEFEKIAAEVTEGNSLRPVERARFESAQAAPKNVRAA